MPQPARLHRPHDGRLHPRRRRAEPPIWSGTARPETGPRPRSARSGSWITYRGVLVRDDYGGYLSYDDDLAGVQQCLAHALRYLDDAYAIDPRPQGWARQVADTLRETIGAVNTARATAGPACTPVCWLGCAAPTTAASRSGSRRTSPGDGTRATTPDYNWRNDCAARPTKCGSSRPAFDVPATNNGSESAIRGYKLAAKVSGCWRTLATLQRHCRIRSYLASSRNHGHRSVDAIRDALTGTPWMPPRLTTTATALAA